MTDVTVVTVFSDYICPWCYLGELRLARARQRWQFDVEHVRYPLHPELPPSGVPLEKLFAGAHRAHFEAMNARLREAFADEGVDFSPPARIPNSRLAQELATWASDQPAGEAIHLALFQAYFDQGRDLGDLDTLVDIAVGCGLDGDAARQALISRAMRARVDRDHERAFDAMVTGVPTFAAGSMMLPGARPLEDLERLLEKAGAARRT